MDTDKRIEANRTNAQHSTGPNTPEGKDKSRFNAVTHGLSASDKFFASAMGEEEQEDYDALVAETREAHQPQNRLELILVERVANTFWKLRRVSHAEEALLQLEALDLEPQASEAIENEYWRDIEELHEGILSPPCSTTEERHNETLRRRLRMNPMGARHLLATLTAAAQELLNTSELNEGLVIRIGLEFSEDDESPFTRIQELATETSGQYVFSKEAAVSMIEEIKLRQKELEDTVTKADRAAAFRLKATRAAHSIPNLRDLDRLQRHEVPLQRELFRLVAELDRMQRRRIGEPPTPRLEVSLVP